MLQNNGSQHKSRAMTNCNNKKNATTNYVTAFIMSYKKYILKHLINAII